MNATQIEMTQVEKDDALHLEMIAEAKARKAASRAKSAARTAERKAHAKEVADYAAAQVGPFACIECKVVEVEKFDIMCPCCTAKVKQAANNWYASKPKVVGTF